MRLALGALVGVVAAFGTYGRTFLSGDDTIWHTLGGDAGTALAAFRYYLAEPWGLPLLQIEGLNSPDGLVIYFSDSLSVWALLAKVLSPLGLGANQWFALWYLVIFALQGLAAVAAVRSFGVRSIVTELSVATIAVSAPIMMLRTWHPGLAAQFTILLAWTVVGHLTKGRQNPVPVLWWGSALAVLTVFIQAYLFLCVVVVLAGGALSALANGRLSLAGFARWVGVSALAVGVGGIASGFLGSGAEEVAGYGVFGSYVFGPVIPQWSRLWPGNEWILEANGSFEGFNWLGMGWLLLAVGVLVAVPGRVLQGLRRNQIVVALLALLGAYAITPVVRLWSDDPHDLRTPLGWVVGNLGWHRFIYGLVGLVAALVLAAWFRRQGERWSNYGALAVLAAALGAWSVLMLVSPGLINQVTGQFRVSGRLLWPASYGVLVGAAVLADRWLPKRVVLAVLPLLAMVQVFDVQQFRDQAHDVFLPDSERAAEVTALAEMIGLHQSVHLEPGFNCAAGFGGGPALLAFQDVTIAASLSVTPVDNVYAARQERDSCETAPVLESGGVLNVVMVPLGGGALVVAPRGQECRSLDYMLVCSDRWGQLGSESAVVFAAR